MTTPTLLHVVYAGRGDCFLLQYEAPDPTTHVNRPWLVLIDGGPRTYNSVSASTAPYYKYLISVAGAVYKKLNPGALAGFSPDAIILTHPHHDHLDGIHDMIVDYLGKVRRSGPRRGDQLFFNGPLVLPDFAVGRSEWNPTHKLLATGINAHGYGFELQERASVEGFKFGEEDSANVRHYTRSASVSEAGTFSIDSSPTNETSLVMEHRDSKIVFTGDAPGYKILKAFYSPSIDVTGGGLPPTFEHKDVNIFKIPHHGSLRNTQRAFNTASIPVTVSRSWAILNILNYGFERSTKPLSTLLSYFPH